MSTCVVVGEADNVATALEPIAAGQTVVIRGREIRAAGAIPAGHKIALVDLPAGGTVIKYGSSIGTAVVAIPIGTHVHTHNVASGRGNRRALGRDGSDVSELASSEPI